LTGDDGPFLSVYIPSAEQWQVVRGEVAEAGAPESALTLVDRAVAEDTFDDQVLAVVTNGDHVLVEEHLDDGLVYGRASWAPIADLVPLLKARQERHPSVATSDDPVDIATAVAEDTVDCLEEFKRRMTEDPSTVTAGIHDTAHAITNGKVDVLLVRDDRDERHNIVPEDAAAIDALIRDAILTGASIRVVPVNGPISEGVGALLRN
jgi:hypothetical protein